MFTLTAQNRTETTKAARKALMEAGLIPGIVYGPKQEAMPISLVRGEFAKTLRDAGESSVITLTGLGKDMQVLIHEVEMDPVRHEPRHADLYAIEKGAKVEVAVPLTFVGESLAVKEGANMVTVMHELEIEAAPDALPHELEVDISMLVKVGDKIHVSDIKIPAGVTVKVDGEEVVALIQEPEEEVAEETTAVDMSAIEVEAKGKTDEGEEAV